MLLVYGNVGQIYHPDLTVQFSYLRAAGTLPRAAEKQNQPPKRDDTGCRYGVRERERLAGCGGLNVSQIANKTRTRQRVAPPIHPKLH